MTRSEIINLIIAKRKPIAEQTGRTLRHLENVRMHLGIIFELLSKALQSADDTQKTVLQTVSAEIERLVNEALVNGIRDFSQLRCRFNSQTLNIGVIGNARQGKSTFLQALTGLSGDEIPVAETDHCTGAPSIVINHHETYADIEFFEEKEFLQEIILPFYTQLELTPQPNSFDVFANTPLAQPSRQLTATEQALYEKLKYRKGMAEQYRNNFGKRPERVGKEKIREYIAQQSTDGSKISTWLSVKMATIYCPFRVSDAGNISVCDTPGLGDFICGAEDNLISHIGNNLDAVIMLKRTPKGGVATPEDTQLYDLLPKAVGEFEPKDWSYFIVNRDGTDNETKSFEHQIQQKIKCRRFATLDVRNHDDVLSTFHELLEDIANNQQTLDMTLYSKRVAEVQKGLIGIKEIVTKLEGLFTARNSADTEDTRQAQAMFREEIWDNFGSKLFVYVENLRKKQNADDETFLAKLSEIESELKSIPCLPTEDMLTRQKGTMGLQAAYSFHCRAVRRAVLKYFDNIDKCLHKLFDDLRNEAKKCLEAEDGGKMKNIQFEQVGNQTWWTSFAKEIKLLGITDREKENAKRIADAVKQFDGAMLSFRSFLLPRVLPRFNVLIPEQQEHQPYLFTINADVPELVARIQKAAENAISEALQILRDCAKEPSSALFATLDDLHDALIHTGSADATRDLWSYFYADHRGEVWQKKFQQKEAVHKDRKELKDRIGQIKTAVREAEIHCETPTD